MYKEASGQNINEDKSAIYFSPNTEVTLRQQLSNKVGITQELKDGMYPGLLVFSGSLRRSFSLTSSTVFEKIERLERSPTQLL